MSRAPLLRPRPSSTTTGPAGAPARAPRTARPTTTRSTASSSPSTAAAHRCSSTARSCWPMKARPLGRKGVVVGDRVRVVGDTSGDDGALARIVEVVERTTTLRRTADDDDPVERVIVVQRRAAGRRHRAGRPRAAAAADRPRPRGGVRRRHDAAAVPDQGRPRRPRDAAVDLPLARRAVGGHRARRRPDRGARAAGRAHQRAGRLQRRRQVDAGQRPGARRAAARSASSTPSPAAAGTPRPRPTCCALPDHDGVGGGWIIDTPGIRSFGLAHVQPEDLIGAFPDLDEMTEDCPRGCTHGDDEPECGLDDAVERRRRRPRPGVVVPPAARRAQRQRLLS